MSDTLVTPTVETVWVALDEVDSTGELYDQPELLEHLKINGLVEYDKADGVWFISDHGWTVYEKGPEGTR